MDNNLTILKPKRTYKVLMIAPRPFFIDHGFSVQVVEEYNALQRQGNDVTLCCYHVGEEVDGVKISRSIKVPWYKDPFANVSFHYLYLDFLLLLHSFRVAVKLKPDLIHAHIHEGGLIGIIIGKLLRIPVILDIQGSMLGEYKERGLPHNAIIEKVISSIENTVNRHADGLMVEMEHRKTELLKNPKIRSEKIFLFKLGIDTDLFTKVSRDPNLLNSLNIPEDRKIIGYVGLLTPYQGIDYLLEAMRLVLTKSEDAHFLVMGHQNLEMYKQKAYDLGLNNNVTFTGKIPYRDAHKYLSLCDIAVGPKISLQETNGKLIPYMSMGLPTIAFDTIMNREYLGDLGIYAKYKDSEDLASKILNTLDGIEDHKKNGSKLRKRAIELFGLSNMAENTMQMYEKVIEDYKN